MSSRSRRGSRKGVGRRGESIFVGTNETIVVKVLDVHIEEFVRK